MSAFPGSRFLFLRGGLLLATIGLGLATRRDPAAFPAFIAEYGGDTLYATLWVQLVGLPLSWLATARLAAPRAPWRVALTALLVCFVIEFSQGWDVGWLNAVRATTMGGLVLGHGFLASDLVCYAVGCMLGWGIESGLQWRA